MSDCIKTLRSNIYCIPKDKEYELFGLPISGTMYINKANCGNKAFDRLMTAFYNLNIVNRYADYISEKYSVEVLGKENVVVNNTELHINTIRNRYNINHLDYNVICSTLDSSQRKLYYNIAPENKLEARIMYDMAVAIAYAHDKIDANKCCELLEKKVVSEALAKYQNDNKLEIKEWLHKANATTTIKE